MGLRELRLSGKSALFALAAMLCAIMPLSDASAASRVCRQLEAQLAAASDAGGRGGGQSRKYDQAIERQRNQMAIARSQARDAGCGFAVFGRKVRQCAALNGTIDRMESNLEGLQRTREQLGGGRGGSSRTRILASLDANGCRDDGEEVAIRRPVENLGPVHRRSLLTDLFGGGDEKIGRVEDVDRQEMAGLDPEPEAQVRRIKRVINGEIDDGGPAALSETFATMCVRTCDGYFFPMSHESTQNDFARDQKNCDSSCPGAEMQVFYRSSGAPEDAEMTSATTGRPYSQLSTAYLYKEGAQSRPATCGCNVAKNFEVISDSPPAPKLAAPDAPPAVEPSPQTVSLPASDAPEKPVQPAPSSASFAVPEPLPAPAVEAKAPETGVADDRREIDRSASAIADRAAKAEERKVRVVGPVFLPDPGAALDLRAPAQKQVR